MERTQRSDLEEFWATVDPKATDIEDRLAEWRHFWNWDRLHMALGGNAPIDHICDRLAKMPLADEVEACGHLAEIGVIAAQGLKNARDLAWVIKAEGDETIPACVRAALAPLVRQLHALDQEIARSDQTIAAMARDDEMARRLMTIPGLGPVTASAMATSVQDVSVFSGPREFAAFLGLTPRQNSSGGKERLGRVSKMGNRYLRKLLVVGAHAVLYHRKPHDDALRSWAKKLMQTKPFKLVAVALANKMARIAFAIMLGKTSYSAAPA